MKQKRWHDRTMGAFYKLAIVLMGALVGMLTSEISLAETVAERFEKAMKKKAEYCATHKIDPANRRCDILKLKPADPLATEEGRFAHSIKIPNPVPADSGYKPGMTPEQYFDHLCKTEAGEFIFKTVENVEGLYMMRPREPATDDMKRHLYAVEDPFGQTLEPLSLEDHFVQPPFGKYSFLEIPRPGKGSPPANRTYTRYYRGLASDSPRDFVFMKDNHSESVPYIVQSEQSSTLNSRYGYTWRGIKRPHDRELGIAGGELIIVDLLSNEVLAVRRGFLLGDVDPTRIGLIWKRPCSAFAPNGQFVQRVLKPVN